MPASYSHHISSQSVPAFYGWNDCAINVKESVYSILEYYRKTLDENLTGFYLHGSLAMGCFNPSRSDIDFLAVVHEELLVAQKREIIDFLQRHRKDFPAKGVEMSIIREKDVRALSFPTPYELHYSDGWYERYQKGEIGLSSPQTDEDLVAHFAVIRERGIRLYGQPVDEMFPEIPRSIFIRFLIAEARWVYAKAEEDPLYAVLNLCRILDFLSEGRITSKPEGATWALAALPPEFSPLINTALDCYAGLLAEMKCDNSMFTRFLEYTRDEIGSFEGGK